MNIKLLNTEKGLIPLYDEDFDERKKLKLGETYSATIKKARNVDFHRKYFALINVSWEYLTESQVQFFKNDKDGFRECVQIASGHYKEVYSIKNNEWVQEAKSISFEKLDELGFRDLYERVKDVIYMVFLKHVPQEEFERNLIDF